MRSKQQPRPSYQCWVKPDENDDGDESHRTEPRPLNEEDEEGQHRHKDDDGSVSPTSSQSRKSTTDEDGAPTLVPSALNKIFTCNANESRTKGENKSGGRRRRSNGSATLEDNAHSLNHLQQQRQHHRRDMREEGEDTDEERELASSPTRCLSRDSHDSNGGARSPSDDSVYSGRGLGMTLPATLPPAAAAALLPPQSAAMAAYLGVAAAAAQQNRLFLNSAAASLSGLGIDNPHAAAAAAALLPPGLGLSGLDFSGKRSSSTGSNKSSDTRDIHDKSINSDDEDGGNHGTDHKIEMDDDCEDDEDEVTGGDNDDDNSGVVNLSHKSSAKGMMMRRQQQQQSSGRSGGASGANNGSNNCPLDLTVSRKRSAIDNLALLSAGGNQSSPLHHLAQRHSPQSPGAGSGLPRKLSRLMPDYKQWPYGAAANASAAFFANSLTSPKGDMGASWNGSAGGHNKMKMSSATSDATKALEKMSELSRLGGAGDRNSVSPTTPGGYGSKNVHMNQASSGRHSAWQSHWLNKGADSAKDVLKCVWCKQSFNSLAALTTHMKETKHCGVNMPPNAGVPNPSQNQQAPVHHHHHQQQHHSQMRGSGGGESGRGDRDSNKNDLNLLIKETMPLPRKLVRGQDVWLGKGAEQTRQILKCMWCGQSFRSLAEMTSHMQQTQHYTNIISQEQIISWKTSDDGKGGPPGSAPTPSAAGQGPSASSGNGNAASAGASSDRPPNAGPPSGPHQSAQAAQANSTVSAVLTCKVCDQAFSSLKDLSNHMVKNSHYKEHIMRSITESGSRRRQTREKRKKSLPVRKLLELERAQHDYKNGSELAASVMSKTMREAATGRITCEKCGDKIETALFVDHIRQCVGGVALPPNSMKMSSGAISPLSSRDGRKSSSTTHEEMVSPVSRLISPNDHRQGGSPRDSGESEKNSSPSVLNAIEQLIEKSFDTRSRHSGGTGNGGQNSASASQPSTPLGASILKRLGIDESVDYTKPLIDPQTMNLLRSYQQQQQQHQQMLASGRGRERSGSESSSFSDRTNSRMESLTPDRKYESMSAHSINSRNSPDRKRDSSEDKEDSLPLHRIKREIMEERQEKKEQRARDTPIKIKSEVMDEDRVDSEKKSNEAAEHGHQMKPSSTTSPACSPRRTPVGTPMASPASDRSATPRSVASHDGASKPKSHLSASNSSLGALSSMFDNLSGNQMGGGHDGESVGKEGGGGGNKSGKKGATHHPLAALQKLCDKTETNPARSNSNANPLAALANTAAAALSGQSGATNNGNASAVAGGSGLLAFSWACNDAVMTADSIIKCAFCDTPFISKGAYRHHLSKMHFIKDDGMPDAVAMKSSQRSTPNTPAIAKSPTPPALSPKSANGIGSALPLTANNSNRSPTPTSTSTTPTPGAGGSASVAAFEESPHSKFLKYTELAKQLSSKYVSHS